MWLLLDLRNRGKEYQIEFLQLIEIILLLFQIH